MRNVLPHCHDPFGDNVGVGGLVNPVLVVTVAVQHPLQHLEVIVLNARLWGGKEGERERGRKREGRRGKRREGKEREREREGGERDERRMREREIEGRR